MTEQVQDRWCVRGVVLAAMLALAPLAAGTERSPRATIPSGSSDAASVPAHSVDAWQPTVVKAQNEDTAAPPPANAWTPEEITAAKARCAVLLKGLDAVTVPLAPIKQGDCGAPAPIQLVSLGSNPPVAVSPPATLSCELVAALAAWLKDDLQPLARKHLGSPIVKIETMSSYSCRNAYGRTLTRLSEHGRANAIDIGGFVTAAGSSAGLLASWGPTVREIETARAAAAAAAKQSGAGPRDAKPAIPQTLAGQAPASADSASVAHSSPAEGSAGAAWPMPRAGSAAGGHGFAFFPPPPSRLGGPKPQKTAGAIPPAETPEGHTQFLREAHQAACRIFGTVLGPEANIAHRNHFHLDMAERRSGKFCE